MCLDKDEARPIDRVRFVFSIIETLTVSASERIARAGLLGFVFTGSPPQVHPFGGIDKVLGTNPLAIAVPTENEDPLLIDLATSALSGSRIRQASYFNEEIPEGIGVDANGVPTT